jgi:(p)ppGpp synthase/HD superfamily hydrolase
MDNRCVNGTIKSTHIDLIHSEIIHCLTISQATITIAPERPTERRIARHTSLTLHNWRLPDAVAAVALLLPYLEQGLNDTQRQSIAGRFGPETIPLAERLSQWYAMHLRPSSASGEPYSTQLCRLFREVYLDLPNLHWTLLLIADHAARFALSSGEEEARLAQQTSKVFIPLAQMLGLWRQRRVWLDHVTRIQHPNDFDELLQALGPAENYTEGCFRSIAASAACEAGSQVKVSKPLLAKTKTYLALKEDILRQARKIGLRLRISPIPAYPGSTWQRTQDENTSKDELIKRLSVKVLCHSADDCYRALGIINQLGRPDIMRVNNQLQDYIASPQSNGYRALHTAILYQRQGGDAGASEEKSEIQAPVEFRIYTPHMHRLNEYGVVAALHQRASHYNDPLTWWQGVNGRLSAQLHRRYPHQQASDFKAYLQAHEIGSRSDPLYVFTPRGDIKLIANGATAVDFAYRIHTWVGNHAESIELNGKKAPYHTTLHNGDLVDVHTNPRSSGPDLSWLGFVTTSSARARVNRALSERATQIHKGRSKIESRLIQELQYFQHTKHFNLLITSSQLDTFLERTAIRQHTSAPALYDRIEAQPRLAASLVRQLISESLAPALVKLDGEHLPYPPDRITLCDACRPVPNEPVMAFERPSGGGVMVHYAGEGRRCHWPQHATSIPVRWVERQERQERMQTVLTITAHDRRQLLGDILRLAYLLPDVNVSGIEGGVQPDGSAMITLLVDAQEFASVVRLQNEIDALADVHHVIALPPSTPMALAGMLVAASGQAPNPYTYSQVVYGRLSFYDRVEAIQRILGWLQMPPPYQRFVIHGQRRVGKSSLVQHLQYEVLPRQAAPVVVPAIVDCQSFGAQPSLQTVANHIVRAVCNATATPVPEFLPTDEPFTWLNRTLSDVVKALGQYRLLLVIDEVSHLADQYRLGKLDATMLDFLRALTTARRDMNWLFIVQDVDYYDALAWDAGALLNCEDLHLQDFPPEEALKLIQEPMRRCGMDFEKGIPARIIELTNGNPCLVQAVCWHLVERIRSVGRKPTVNSADLDMVIEEVLNRGQFHFEHYLARLTGLNKAIVSAVAARSAEDNWAEVPGEDVTSLHPSFSAQHAHVQQEDAHQALDRLVKQGVLESEAEPTGATQRVRIRIDLFRKWAQRNLDVNTAIDEWLRQRGKG